MAYELSEMLKVRLVRLGMNETDISLKIEELKKQANAFIEMRLGEIVLTEKQKEILENNYIQYEIFAQLEMESFTQDKRIFLDNLIDDIIRQDKEKRQKQQEERANNSRIRVY